MHNERIELTDTTLTATIKLAEGNPGALTALMKMMQAAPAIDPDSVWREYGPLLALDSMGIYGSHIWMLWKDVCGCDPVKVGTLFRAKQLGMLRTSQVTSAASTGQHSFDFLALLTKVQEELPAFGRTPLPA